MNRTRKKEWISTYTNAERPDVHQNVVLYLRTATRGQGGGSTLEAQRESLQRWALEHGCTVLHTFEDEGVSAHSDAATRPGFGAMLAYCREHSVDQVLIHRWDRLARSRAGCDALIRQLQNAGVTVRPISGEAGPDEWQSSTVAA